MKNELKLWQIYPYLRYGLEFETKSFGVLGQKIIKKETIDCIDVNENILCLSETGDYYLDSNENEFYIKPLLKPIDRLLKDKEFKNMLKENIFDGLEYELTEALGLVALRIGDTKTLLVVDDEIADDCPYFVYDWLLRNHYDIFNLIGKKLAKKKKSVGKKSLRELNTDK
jgi:hypothetical protein